MSRRKPGQPYRRPIFPPPPSWPRDETLTFGEAEGGLAVLLWQRCRDVRLWGAAPEGERAGLFAGVETNERALEEGAGALPEEIVAPLRTISALVRYPEMVQPRDVCVACLAVSEWADAAHMAETALQYAEAAALADPGNGQAAAVAGSACAQVAEDNRATVWFHRSIRIAQRMKDWEWYARALIRLGMLHYELGEPRSAWLYDDGIHLTGGHKEGR